MWFCKTLVLEVEFEVLERSSWTNVAAMLDGQPPDREDPV